MLKNMERFFAGNLEREFIELTIHRNSSGAIESFDLSGLGRLELLRGIADLRQELKQGQLPARPPEGCEPHQILLREIVKKARSEWVFPYAQSELCHCRAVPADIVDQAIVYGAHTPEKVSEWTSASTACGSCRFDVEALLRYRLNSDVNEPSAAHGADFPAGTVRRD
jgi:NAD(P)H-nitrite reductase large subunit